MGKKGGWARGREWGRVMGWRASASLVTNSSLLALTVCQVCLSYSTLPNNACAHTKKGKQATKQSRRYGVVLYIVCQPIYRHLKCRIICKVIAYTQTRPVYMNQTAMQMRFSAPFAFLFRSGVESGGGVEGRKCCSVAWETRRSIRQDVRLRRRL